MIADRFPPLKVPSFLLASPHDVSYLRQLAMRVYYDLNAEFSAAEDVELYAWEKVTATDPFDDLVPAQEQIPRPDDPLCRGVVAFFGEWIGRPLAGDFPIEFLDPIQPSSAGQGYRLVHPWRPGTEESGGFPLTGSTFEVLAAIASKRRAYESGKRQVTPLFLRFVGSPGVLDEPNVGRAAWGNRKLVHRVEHDFANDIDEKLRRQFIVLQQLRQLRNFAMYLSDVLGHVLNFVADEDAAEEQLKSWWLDRLGLSKRRPARDPFKGLQSYDVEDADVFWGRESERKDALRNIDSLWKLDTPRWYWVRGFSGTGKSSFLRAGLVGYMPRRLSDRAERYCVIRPNDLAEYGSPSDETRIHGPLLRLFKLCVTRICEGSDEADWCEGFIAARVDDFEDVPHEKKVEWAVRNVSQCLDRQANSKAGGALATHLILGFDQFEEAVDMLGEERTASVWGSLIEFVVLLARQPRILVLATIREDRITALGDNPHLATLYRESVHHHTFLELPNRTSLQKVIYEMFGSVPAPALAQDFISTLTTRIHDFAVSTGRVTKPSSMLPLISLTLERLYNEVAVPMLDEQRNFGSQQSSGSTQEQFEVAADAQGAGPLPVLSLERAADYLDIGSSINKLAGEAVEEAKTAIGPNWDDSSIGDLLRRLISWTDTTEQQFSLPAVPWPTESAVATLSAAMKRRRLIVPEANNRIRLVHEAVVSNWPPARDWLEYERPLLNELAQMQGFAVKWRNKKFNETFLQGLSLIYIDPASRMLSLWFDLFDGLPSDLAPENKATLRDFCLTLVGVHNSAGEIVEQTPRRPPHLQLAVAYQRLDIARKMLETSPDAIDITRSDGRTALFYPAFQGNLAMIDLLLEFGAKPDAPDQKQWRAIHAAAVHGSVEVVARLIAAGASPEAAGAPFGTAPIHLAADYGHAPLLHYFVSEKKVLVDLRDEYGMTPLMRAAQANQESLVRAAISLDADLRTTLQPGGNDDFGWTAIHFAARNGASDAVNVLLEAGLDVNQPLANGATALHLATFNTQVNTMRLLIKRGADLEACSMEQWTAAAVRTSARRGAKTKPDSGDGKFDLTPLHLAAANNKAEAAKVLLEAHADPNAATGSGATGLHLAAEKNAADLVNIFLSYRANPELRDSSGHTPLQLALEKHMFNSARRLIEGGANSAAVLQLPDLQHSRPDPLQLTSLHRAVAEGDADIVRFLLKQKVNCELADSRYWTPLHYAAASGQTKISEWLLQQGARPWVKDADGITPMHLASRGAFSTVLSLMISAYGSDWTPCRDDITLLHLAARSKSVPCARVLLEAGHPVNPHDCYGWTPLHCAAQAGADEVVDLLLQFGADVHIVAKDPPLNALQFAAQAGQTGCIRRLVKDFTLDCGSIAESELSAIFLAMRYRQYESAALLIRAGASLEGPDQETWLGLFETYCSQVNDALSLGISPSGSPALETLFAEKGFIVGSLNAIDPRTHQQSGEIQIPPYRTSSSYSTMPLQFGATAFFPDLNTIDPNPWSTIDPNGREELLARISPVDGKYALSVEDTDIKLRLLPFYEEVLLIHVSNSTLAEKNINLFYLSHNEALFRLNGVSPPIHEINAKAPLKLNEQNILDYLRFFSFFVQGEEGPFYISESPDDPLLPAVMDSATASVVRGTVRPAVFSKLTEQGHYLCDAVVFYSNAIFIAAFAVLPSGMVEMLDDEPIAADLPCRVQAPLA